MRQRQEILTRVLTEHFGVGINPGNSMNSQALEKARLLKEIKRIWSKLGGLSNEIPIKFGGWDIVLKDFIVELDEEQHFNRYRAVTLKSYIYHREQGFDIFDYAKYCAAYESHCLKKSSWGKYWKSPSTEKQFGLPGDIENSGSPRWKQRAFYDYLRDVFAMVYRVPLIRISVYDNLIANGQISTLGELLQDKNLLSLSEIVKFIENKIKKVI